MKRYIIYLLLVCFVTTSCNSANLSAPTQQPEEPRTELLVAATFTPSPTPSELLEVTPAATTITDQPEDTGTSTPVPEPQSSPAIQEIIAQITITAGDALINIALKYELPMAAIQLANDMGDTTIVRVGQVLDIPDPENWSKASPYWVIYSVQAGESLSKIAAKYGLSVADIVNANNFEQADIITVGQSIILPLEGPIRIASASLAPIATQITPSATPTTIAPEPVDVLPDTPTPTLQNPTSTPEPAPIPEYTGDTSALRLDIFRLINEQRAIYGFVPLAWNDILASAAQKHADDCYARGWCGHTGSDGSTMKTRIIREGYDPVRWSECWAWYGTPEKAVEMWMDEEPPNDPHRRTILSPHLTEVGVGVVPGNGNGYYFIADFGTPRQ